MYDRLLASIVLVDKWENLIIIIDTESELTANLADNVTVFSFLKRHIF